MLACPGVSVPFRNTLEQFGSTFSTELFELLQVTQEESTVPSLYSMVVHSGRDTILPFSAAVLKSEYQGAWATMPATAFWDTEMMAVRLREVALVTTFSKFCKTMLWNWHVTLMLGLELSLTLTFRRNRTSEVFFGLLLRVA